MNARVLSSWFGGGVSDRRLGGCDCAAHFVYRAAGWSSQWPTGQAGSYRRYGGSPDIASPE